MKTQNPHLLSSHGLALIEAHEARRFGIYLCPANKATIGVGHVLLPKFDTALFKNMTTSQLTRLINDCQKIDVGQKQGKITKEASQLLYINDAQVDQLLSKDTAQTSLFLNSVARVALNQNQFDALVSFIFNIGQGNYAGSTLRKKLDAGDYAGAAAEMDKWVYDTVNGKKQKVNGLIKRRADERALFESL